MNYAAKYLGLVAPLNTALDQLRKVPPKKAVPAAVLSGIAKASANFGTAMLRVKWPGPTTASDVRALVQANAAFSGDLSQINHQNAASIAAYRSQLARDDQVSGGGREEGARRPRTAAAEAMSDQAVWIAFDGFDFGLVPRALVAVTVQV